ncbi:MAG: Coenzyme F420 hydrogenase/dehydrogenase, beta subunit C-terminal domain, partial [Clostridia bacterium]|nr:Coenzyme F420 hydrogenase/dehydrogenase, beta subunit C-terminal domain [Clostridia bacterium]
MQHPLNDPTRCNGCGACAQKCPKGAIAMRPDAEGFFRPVIDAAVCVDCGLCDAVCVVNHPPKSAEAPKAFAAYAKQSEIRMASSSGGVFSVLAAQILAMGGAVVGAAMDADGIVRHRVVTDADAMAALRGSKYVQSEAWHVYPKVRELLENGCAVLFTGTPCQVNALARWLGKPYEKLYLADIVCHGVPSPKAWQVYRAKRAAEADSAITAVNFRDKSESWLRFGLSVHFVNGKTYRIARERDSFMRAFLKDAVLRPSCHSCAAKGLQRSADLTLADFWGVTSVLPQLDYADGVSLVLLHTSKGNELFARCSADLQVVSTDAKRALVANPAYACSVAPHPARAHVFAQL